MLAGPSNNSLWQLLWQPAVQQAEQSSEFIQASNQRFPCCGVALGRLFKVSVQPLLPSWFLPAFQTPLPALLHIALVREAFSTYSDPGRFWRWPIQPGQGDLEQWGRGFTKKGAQFVSGVTVTGSKSLNRPSAVRCLHPGRRPSGRSL